MPNDTDTLNRIAPTSPHFRDLGDRLQVPTLDALAYALRNRDVWPKGFVWDYSDCETCAHGLASKLWNGGQYCNEDEMNALFGIDKLAGDSIFYGVARGIRSCMSDVTPEMVADAIDTYLAQSPQA